MYITQYGKAKKTEIKKVTKPKIVKLAKKREIKKITKAAKEDIVKVEKLETSPKTEKPESKLTKEIEKLVELPTPVKLKKLPEFKELRKKEKSIKHSLGDIVKKLTRGKKQISEQIDVIGKQKKIIETERKQFKELRSHPLTQNIPIILISDNGNPDITDGDTLTELFSEPFKIKHLRHVIDRWTTFRSLYIKQ